MDPIQKWRTDHDICGLLSFLGYQVEADVWYDKGWWFGHNEPQYKVPNRNFLYQFWCHAKNLEAMERMSLRPYMYHYFWHDKDDYTLTSRGFIWTYPGKALGKKCIAVMPELSQWDDLSMCAGICSDFVRKHKKV